MLSLLHRTHVYYCTINSSTKRLDTYGGNPTQSSAPARSFEPGIPSELEIPGSDLQDSGIHQARFLLTPLAFPWRFPRYVATRLPRKGGYPGTREGLSRLPRIFRRHQHPPFGCQPRSPECSKYTQPTAICPRRTLPDSVGFPTGFPSEWISHFRQVPFLPRIY